MVAFVLLDQFHDFYVVGQQLLVVFQEVGPNFKIGGQGLVQGLQSLAVAAFHEVGVSQEIEERGIVVGL